MRPWIVQIDGRAVGAAAAACGFTGVVAIDAGEERVFERCYGFAHRGLAVPNTVGTRFALASGSKTFTAVAVLRLVEQGRLRLTDRVRPILGDDLPLVDDAVTIEHLLTHTSGIGDYLDEEADWKPDDYVLTVPAHVLAETSPRTLQSWDITFTGAPKAPLALDKGIPVGKSLAQLKALYPEGGGLEHMGAWSAEDVVLIPPTNVGGETIVHAGDLDWCT